jgi:serine/threonine protein kinase
MPDFDATILAQQAVRLGLLTQAQVQDAWEELGTRGGPPDPFLRCLERKCYLTPWQTAKLAKGETDGFFLGGYRILYKVASGSFGRVYRAEDQGTGTIVAIKVLRRKWTEKEQKIELFEREGKVGMSLRHPNVVQILAVNRDTLSKQYYIVMEFVEGGNLRDFLAIRKKLEAAEALRITEEVATGLSYANSRGLSHRDIKLTNVLISSQGTAKLVDFGLADYNQADEREEGGHVDRSVDYAGLERATAVLPGDVRSDIYFLGCVLYELLTGRAPLDMPKNPRERMRPERFTNVQPIDRTEVNGPPALFRLLETMMSLVPEQRFQTPSQLLEAIRDVRRELEGKTARTQVGRSLFLVEKDERLQDALRDKFKDLGFRVFIAIDPARALDRYRQQPYDVLIIDAGTTGEDGLWLFDRVMREAKRQRAFCAGVLILSESQRDWVDKVEARGAVSILVRPVTLKQLHHEVNELLATQSAEM